MNLKQLSNLVFIVMALGALLACQNEQNSTVGDNGLGDDNTVISDEPTALPERAVSQWTSRSGNKPEQSWNRFVLDGAI